MSAIKSVIKEEYHRLCQLRDKYERELDKLPKGAISIKKRGSHSYMYLASRKGEKVKFSYIGSINSSEAEKIKKQFIIRDKYRKNLQKVKQDLKEVRKMIRERKTRTVY